MGNLPVIANVVRADLEKTAHIAQKQRNVDLAKLRWVAHGEFHFVAQVPGGHYILRRKDSGSRVKRHRYRWAAIWAPIDSPDIKELALERRYQWAKGAAEAHYERTRNA